VVVPKGSSKNGPYKWTSKLTGHKVKRALRTRKSIRVLSDPSDEAQWIKALGRNPKDKKRGVIYIYAIDANELRNSTLKRFGDRLTITDVVGFVMKFPESKSAATADYVGQPSGQA